MTARRRFWLAAIIGILLLAGAAGYGIVAWAEHRARASAPSEVESVASDVRPAGARIVFRNTALGAGYGLVASVPLSDPSAARSVTDLACDRVYATAAVQSCLHIDRGVVTTFNGTLSDASGRETRSWPLAGVPSRTRISADSRLVAATSFVTGEAYGTVGFATMTTISRTDGSQDYGNLEDFALLVDDVLITAADRNVWGVTFSDDDNTFYATAASNNQTWLVRGDLAARTLTAIRDTAECPSLSPDGGRIAYKKEVSTSVTPQWSIAVLDLATGTETLLHEKRNVDDQVLWLDDDTLLYGLAREDTVGDSDVWSVSADGTAVPELFLAHAWSPSVVR
ncbi:hypothetical protein E3O42_00070 [Cryobacterium adonitolivorans]|uniref:TolB-like translocation protein n=1 Tax=Cryobacterium adonitolivorans TaxID=1259189 RepID=A0A4V3IDJ3_9MICO|nr:hypothetical protein [Cryobacterium adonitolivorans]TFC07178.1 hypothetical protein E3O42_00070 [Cryobacterium adonitolivorans]